MLFPFGVGPFFGVGDVEAGERVISTLDKAYSARPLAQQLAAKAPDVETVAVFRVRRDIEYGLSFYRNREVEAAEDGWRRIEQHLLVVRVLHTASRPRIRRRRWMSTLKDGTTNRCSPGRSRD